MKSLLSLVAVLALVASGFVNPKSPHTDKEYSLIPSGTLVYDDKKVTIQGFYIQKTEVTNKQYKAFLQDLLANQKQDDYEKAKIDSAGWLKHSEYLAKNYQTNQFDDYPVVNISREGALLYCKWLTEKLNKQRGDNVIARLPTAEEWMYAAMGGVENAAMPWGGAYLCNAKGQYLLNFAVDSSLREKCMAARNPSKRNIDVVKSKALGDIAPEERETFTSPVHSYWANPYGLYNMCGNAAEMTATAGSTKGGSWETSGKYVWIQSKFDAYEGVTDPSPGIGFRPVFTYLGK